MGWTCCYNAKHFKWKNGRQIVDRKKCVDDIYTGENGQINYKVLKSTMVGSVWYGAVKIDDNAEGTTRISAGICLTCGGSRHDGTIWGYKDMDETVGPNRYDCPKSIIKMLTPIDNEYANEWRKKCLEYKTNDKKLKNFTLPKGIEMNYKGGWIISSPEYRYNNYYTGVRYRRLRKLEAVNCFINEYGTNAQKEEWEKTKPKT